MSNVYKGLGLINKIDKVKIPDIDINEKHEEEPQDNFGTVNEFQFEVETNILEDNNQISADENSSYTDSTEKMVEEEIPEPEPEPVLLSLEEIRDMYEEDLKMLTTEVAQKAYYDAIYEKRAELRKTMADVQKSMDQLVENQVQFIEQYTNELKYMAVEIAQKMILEKIDEDDLVLERLVLQTVNSVKNAEWLNVELAERLVNLVDCVKHELEKPEYYGRAYVFPVAGTDDICRVTSEDGTIVSTISVQAENLKKVFKEVDQQ